MAIVLLDHLLCVQSRLGSQQTVQVWIVGADMRIAHHPQACFVLQLPIRVHFDPKLVPLQMEQFPILLASTANVVQRIAH